jgi:hypothetical protein
MPSYFLAACTRCGRQIRLARHRLGIPCRMTPNCPGTHQKAEPQETPPEDPR